ncbi:unnamed protein product [Mytilus edulis]|uniref:Ig-like domain-containing protein n=1 Tax=Mytilus edulis TaxID=6550 RepID=A0A8S3TBC2_MYTED|nr:unnamed protein product [Mytilus edulis]
MQDAKETAVTTIDLKYVIQERASFYIYNVYQENKEEILYQLPRHQNGTSLSLYFHQNNQSFVDIELTSKCFHASTCTGFMCKRCYPQAPAVTVPHSWTGAIGEIISIPCNISQLDEYTSIQWLKHNGSVNKTILILESDRFSGGTFKSPGLKIVSAQQQDEGNYSCHAKNFKKEGSSHSVCLRIFEHPSVNITDIDPVVEGTNVTIQCYVSPSSEVINITWDRNNSTLDIQGNDRYDGGTISSPSLEIYFVQENDDGNYTCKAVNPVGIDIPKVHISRIEAVTVGENVIIPCNISSVSELTKVVWSKDSIEFNLNTNRTEEDNRFSKGTLQDPSLTIYSVQMTDEGNYTCNATNAAEQTGWNKPVHLTVFGANVPSTIETTKPSTVSSSIKTTIATTSTHVPSTKYSYSSSTRKPFNTASSTLTPTRKSTTTLFSSKPTNTVTSTVRPTTKHMSVSSSYNLPKYTTGSKPPTQISYSSSTVKTSTTTSSTVKISTKTSFTSDSPVTSTSAIGSTVSELHNKKDSEIRQNPHLTQRT